MLDVLLLREKNIEEFEKDLFRSKRCFENFLFKAFKSYTDGIKEGCSWVYQQNDWKNESTG